MTDYSSPVRCKECNCELFDLIPTGEVSMVKFGNKEENPFPRKAILCRSCGSEFKVKVPIHFENSRIYNLSSSEMKKAEALLGAGGNRWKSGWSDLK